MVYNASACVAAGGAGPGATGAGAGAGGAGTARLWGAPMEVEAVRRDDELLQAVCHSPVAIH